MKQKLESKQTLFCSTGTELPPLAVSTPTQRSYTSLRTVCSFNYISTPLNRLASEQELDHLALHTFIRGAIGDYRQKWGSKTSFPRGLQEGYVHSMQQCHSH